MDAMKSGAASKNGDPLAMVQGESGGLFAQADPFSASYEEIRQQQEEQQQERLTLSELLNALDGILETPGRILIMTTNDPSVLFNALVRPGRMDLKIEVGNCDRPVIVDFLSYFYDESHESVTELIRDMAYESELAQAEVSCIIQNSMFSLPGAIKEMREKLQADAEAAKE
eukprot:scaffold6104_cov105-Pinguiococcus_pyrenoidosus.AAC.1